MALPGCCMVALPPFIFLAAIISTTVKSLTLPITTRRRARGLLDSLGDGDVARILQRSRPRQLAWRGALRNPKYLAHRETWLNLLVHGRAVPAVVGYFEETSEEEVLSYTLGYAFRHPGGRLEVVIDRGGSVKGLPPAFTVCRQRLFHRYTPKVGQQLTALIDEQGRHLLVESLEIDEAETLDPSL